MTDTEKLDLILSEMQGMKQEIPVADKNLAYEVKANYLVERV